MEMWECGWGDGACAKNIAVRTCSEDIPRAADQRSVSHIRIPTEGRAR